MNVLYISRRRHQHQEARWPQVQGDPGQTTTRIIGKNCLLLRHTQRRADARNQQQEKKPGLWRFSSPVNSFTANSCSESVAIAVAEVDNADESGEAGPVLAFIDAAKPPPCCGEESVSPVLGVASELGPVVSCSSTPSGDASGSPVFGVANELGPVVSCSSTAS